MVDFPSYQRLHVIADAFHSFYQFQDSFAFLVLAALGLAIIFGMMGVINLAHGEFMMLGAYITVWSARNGLPLPLAMLLAALCVGAFGAVVEMLIVRRLYGRLLDTVAATWALGLILTQGMLIIAGPSFAGVSSPFGSFRVGGTSYSTYRLVLGGIAALLLILLYLLFMKTRFGLRSRATIQNPEIAQAMGVNTARMYTLTFAIGSAFAGLAGGLYAPTMTIVPQYGTTFIVEAFVTVIVGGSNVLIGATLSGAFLGIVNSWLAQTWGTYIARVGLLVATVVIIRVMPTGISGLIERWQLRAGRAG